MSGEKNLSKLLASMSPEVLSEEYVFCTVAAEYGAYCELKPLATFTEKEGLTLVITKQSADLAQLSYESIFKGITLTIHSSLDAVGLTAAVSGKLAEKGISANVIAAYYHDHIFVQKEKIDLAVDALNEFSVLAH